MKRFSLQTSAYQVENHNKMADIGTAVHDPSHQPQNSGIAVNLNNITNPFIIIHTLEFVLSLVVLICVAQTNSSEIHPFGYIIAVSVFSMIFAVVWTILMLFGLWPTQQPIKLTRLICGLILSEFYLAAFALCCGVADMVNVPGEASKVKAGFAAGAFFSCLAWLTHATDVGLAWYLHGGIWPKPRPNA